MNDYQFERIMLEFASLREDLLAKKAPPSITHVVVAYDDQPERYTYFAKMCRKMGWMFCCVEHPEALEQLLENYSVLGVLLDHDLREVDGGVLNGVMVAQQCLTHRNVPVIITSANRPGANNIARLLKHHDTPFHIASVLEPQPDDRWMSVLVQIHTQIAEAKSLLEG
jgi:CheY-like chemotaxis protein